MDRMNRAACICVALAFCAMHVTRAQQSQPRAAAPATPNMLGGGTPTPRKAAAMQAAQRAVALCSGMWDGGRTIEQINADNGGLGGTESMKTDIDYARKIVSIKYSDAMPPRIVAWRPVLGCVQLPMLSRAQQMPPGCAGVLSTPWPVMRMVAPLAGVSRLRRKKPR